MKKTEFESIFTAARNMTDMVGEVEKALHADLYECFTPIQDIYDALESSTGVKWDDVIWDLVFDSEKDIHEVLTAIETYVTETKKEKGEKEIQVFDKE